MKKIHLKILIPAILIAVIILIVNLTGIWPFLNRPINYLMAGTPDKSCQTDADCKIKPTQCGYCGDCGDAVNKNWNQFCLFKTHFTVLYCESCPPWQVKCVNGECQKVWPQQQVTDFNSCVAAGNPVLESYPRQCSSDGLTFTEVISDNLNCTQEVKTCPDGTSIGRVGPDCEFSDCSEPESVLTEAQARAIAEATCIKGGEALTEGNYNANSQTWWFDANLNATKDGCNPACVVNEATKTAEINWRCTGLIVP